MVCGEIALELNPEVAAGVGLRAGALQERERPAVQSEVARGALERAARDARKHLAEIENELIVAEDLPLAERVIHSEPRGQVLRQSGGGSPRGRLIGVEEEAHVLGEGARRAE